MTIKTRGRTRNTARRSAFTAANGKFALTPAKIPLPEIPVIAIRRLPLISLLDDESKNLRSTFPSTAFYEPIGNNLAGENLSEKAKESIKEGLKKENMICCSCGPGVTCATNPECNCRIIAQSLANKFTGGKLMKYGEATPYSDADNGNPFLNNTFFNCGINCSCKGKCSLNALQDLKENNFSIKRVDDRGFCLYSKVRFAKGTSIVSFNGEMVGYNKVTTDEEIEQYAMQLIGGDERLGNWVATAPGLSYKYLQILKETFSRKVWINPLKKGNCSRFLSHSCDPNVTLIRVFQGGLSPINMRIIMVALKEILLNDELTFYYGELYKKKFLEKCLCAPCVQQRQLRRTRSSVSDESDDEDGLSVYGTPPTSPSLRPRFNLNRVKREIESQDRETPDRIIETPEPFYTPNAPRVRIKEEIISDVEDSDDEPASMDHDDDPDFRLPYQLRRVRMNPEDPEIIEVPSTSRRGRSTQRGSSVLNIRRSLKDELMDHSPSPARNHLMTLRNRSASRNPNRERSVSRGRHPARIEAKSVPPRGVSRSRSVVRAREPSQVAEERPRRRTINRVERYTPAPAPTPSVRRSTRQSMARQSVAPQAQPTGTRRSSRLSAKH